MRDPLPEVELEAPPHPYVPPLDAAAVEDSAAPAEPAWFERASDLLAEADPGMTPFLVAELVVDGALCAVSGPPKVSKTWLTLELAVSIVSGQPAFGRFGIQQGPVLLILEESGRAALHRRLGALARGRAIAPAELAELHFAANRRVRLDDLEWQKRLTEAVQRIEPAAVVLDPLARLKSPGRDENAQGDMAVLLDVMRSLRDCIDGRQVTTLFVHHEGHGAAGRMRGSSDLESYWESVVRMRKVGADDDEDAAVEFSSEHREAEAGGPWRFRQAWDHDTRSVRLRLTEEDLDALVRAHLAAHPDDSANDVDNALEGHRRQDVLAAVRRVKAQGGSGPGNHPEPPARGSLASGSRTGALPPLGEPYGNHPRASGSGG
jgi:RecA-family ATPase